MAEMFGFGDLDMNAEIRIDLMRPAGGGRLLRLCDQESGLCLEKSLDPHLAVLPQQARWMRAFRDLLREIANAE